MAFEFVSAVNGMWNTAGVPVPVSTLRKKEEEQVIGRDFGVVATSAAVNLPGESVTTLYTEPQVLETTPRIRSGTVTPRGRPKHSAHFSIAGRAISGPRTGLAACRRVIVVKARDGVVELPIK